MVPALNPSARPGDDMEGPGAWFFSEESSTGCVPSPRFESVASPSRARPPAPLQRCARLDAQCRDRHRSRTPFVRSPRAASGAVVLIACTPSSLGQTAAELLTIGGYNARDMVLGRTSRASSTPHWVPSRSCGTSAASDAANGVSRDSSTRGRSSGDARPGAARRRRAGCGAARAVMQFDVGGGRHKSGPHS